MTLWKQGEGKYSNKESKFAINFREDHPDLFAKLSDKGFLVPGKTLTEGGYVYNVKEITSKKTGKNFVLVERKKDNTTGDPIIDSLPDNEEKEAHKAVQSGSYATDKQAQESKWEEVRKRQDLRDAKFEKHHNELVAAINSLTESVNALIKRMDSSKEGI